MVAFQEGDRETGLRLSLECASVSGSLDFRWFQGEYEPHIERVQGEEFETGRRRVRTLSIEDAVAYAIRDLD